jgi:hypothetical protein
VPFQIAVIGAGDAPASVEVVAEQVGAALAQLGAVVVIAVDGEYGTLLRRDPCAPLGDSRNRDLYMEPRAT